MRKIKLLCFLASIFGITCLSVPSMAVDDNVTYVEVGVYDYTTQESHIEKLFVDNNLNATSGYIPDQELSVISEGDSLDTYFIGHPFQPVDISSYPYKAIVLVRNGFDLDEDGVPETWTGGTGFMVHNRVLLTACHTIYHTTENVWANQYRVYKQYESTAIPENTTTTYYLPQQWIYVQNFLTTHDAKDDWCVVQLQSSIGYQTGYLACSVPSNNVLYTAVTVSGYPDVSGYQYQQYKSSGEITNINSDFLFYNASNLGGTSGGPAFSLGNTVYAVNAYQGVYENFGPRINSTIISAILNYS